MDKRKRIASIERWLRRKALSNAPALREAVITTLRLLVERDVISSRDVMQALGCSKQYACRVIDCLVRRHILTTTTPHRRGRGVRYTLAPPRPYEKSESKQQNPKSRTNGLKRISQQAKPISRQASPRKRTCKPLWDDEVLQLRGGQELIPRRPWMRDYMRLARWQAHVHLSGDKRINQMVAAVAYNVVKTYHLTIERAAALLKSLCATLKQVLARGRRITIKAVTWAVRRYLISLGLVRVRRRRGSKHHHPERTSMRTVAAVLATALAHHQALTQQLHNAAAQPTDNEPQATSSTAAPQPNNYVDMGDIVNRYYRAHVQPSPSRAEQRDNSERAAEVILRALATASEPKHTKPERKMTTQQVIEWYQRFKKQNEART